MLFALLLVCVALVVVLPLIGAALSILWSVLLGFALGALARVIAPGHGRLSVLFTTVAGIAGGLIGGVVAKGLHTGLLGRLLLQLLAAVVLVIALRPQGRKGAGKGSKRSRVRS